MSILVDIAVQLNVWRVIGVSGMRAQELANSVLPGAGYFLAALVVMGGLVFNIGNIGGTALGTNAMFGLDVKIGGAISAVIAIGIFLSKRAGVAMDRIVVVLGPADDRAWSPTPPSSRARPSVRRCARPCCPTRSTSSSSPP